MDTNVYKYYYRVIINMNKENKFIDSKEYKEQMLELLKDYIDIKREAGTLGYDSEAFKLRDYIDYYVRLNGSK